MTVSKIGAPPQIFHFCVLIGFIVIFYEPNVSTLQPPEPKTNGGAECRVVRLCFIYPGLIGPIMKSKINAIIR